MGIVGSYLDLDVSIVEEFIIDSDEVRRIKNFSTTVFFIV